MYSFRRYLILFLGLAGYAHTEPLTFDAALNLAEKHSPRLAAQSAQINAAQEASFSADTLPDPQIFAGVENFPVSGPESGSLTRDFMTMQKIGVMQSIPSSHKRNARQKIANLLIESESAKLRVDRLIVRRETARAWITRRYLENRLALFDELRRENELFSEGVKSQLVGGKGMLSDVLLPKEEAAELDDQRDKLQRDIAFSTAALRRWIGEAANEPLVGDTPIKSISPTRIRQHSNEHPEIAMFEPMLHMAKAEIQEAEANKQADWGVEFSYGHRDEEFGDMVSLQFNMDIPVYPKQRQDPLIRAKRSNYSRLDAMRADAIRMHWEKLEKALAEYELLSHQVERIRNQRLPLAREKIELQMAGYRSGKTSLINVLEARRASINLRLKEIVLEGKRVSTATLLHIFYGETPL